MTDLSLAQDVTPGDALSTDLRVLPATVTRRSVGAVLGGGVFAALAASWLGKLVTTSTSEGISRRAGAWTSFGTVAVLRAERQARLGGAPSDAGHGDHAATSVASLEPGNHTFADVVAVEVEVHNGTGHPVLLSAGQLRLRLGDQGPTVTPRDSGRAVGAIEAGATERLWVSYLAPSDAGQLSLEFTDPRQESPLQLDLPSVVRRPGAAGVLS